MVRLQKKKKLAVGKQGQKTHDDFFSIPTLMLVARTAH